MRDRENGGKERERTGAERERERGGREDRGCLGALICFPLQGSLRFPSAGLVLF